MPNTNDSKHDPYNLSRFVQAQEAVFAQVLGEISRGHKRTHWMWYIFPQLAGLGHSSTAQFYAIQGIQEAQAYLAHPLLGPRLLQCAQALLAVRGRSAVAIFGSPDDLKLRSCATLFAWVSPPGSVFHRLLDNYFRGQPDPRTLELLGRDPSAPPRAQPM